MDVQSTYLKMEVANAWTILLKYINSITKKPFPYTIITGRL
jgi:hypothetical protein